MTAFLSILLLVLQAPQAQGTCAWGTAQEIGTLGKEVSESSGVAVSRKYSDRAYSHNDSGDSGRFFVMDLDGRHSDQVKITGFVPVDMEDMAIGRCKETQDCLFFGDIGDNARKRRDLELVIVRERKSFPKAVEPDYRVILRYPDGSHDAEALGVHPNGDVFVITKDAATSSIYKLKASQWQTGKGPQVMERVATVSWPAVLPNSLPFPRPTGMAIAPDGKRFLVLTYVEAVEFYFDLSKPLPPANTWKEGREYRRIPITTLEQEEAIAYLPDGRGFLYTTERALASRVPRIMRVNCAP